MADLYTNTMYNWRHTISLFCILQTYHAGATIQTSRACYGSIGSGSCTLHDISCSCSLRITISDAYYTNNTECGITGLSRCATINPDSITEHGYFKFNDTELLPLYNICSTKTQCVYPAPRRSAFLSFSVVKYQCMARITTDGPNTGATEGPSSTPASSHDQFPVGVFMGGAGAGGVVVALAVIAGYFLILRRRYDITTKTPAPSLPFTDHPTSADLSARVDVNNYAVMGQPSISPEDATHDASLPASDYQTI
ncbi:uncharacterized protein LOC124130234 [Haliotis rufescens]|uniref:uncharacterized protein LOC124130234 n=1 Tax=Haliotis rufescens TaxID=6454 RepID=UPI00201F3BD2|nr:uncharacterized protein LOC124130234 [Haliotis rufescens]